MVTKGQCADDVNVIKSESKLERRDYRYFPAVIATFEVCGGAYDVTH